MTYKFDWKGYLKQMRRRQDPVYAPAWEVNEDAASSSLPERPSNNTNGRCNGRCVMLNTFCSQYCPGNRSAYVFVLGFIVMVIMISSFDKKHHDNAPTLSPIRLGMYPNSFPSPAMNPTPNNEGETYAEFSELEKEVIKKLEFVSGGAVMQPGTPQYYGAQWIMNEDQLHLLSNSPFLIQRYILTIFYYQMGGDNIWSPNDNWMDGIAGECTWTGVACDGDAKIVDLNFEGIGLTGSIPTEIWALSELKNLDLSSNQISGEIPYELGLIDTLEILKLDGNTLIGKVPNQICTQRDQGRLEIFTADCKNDSEEQVICSCCSNCGDNAIDNSLPIISHEDNSKFDPIDISNNDDTGNNSGASNGSSNTDGSINISDKNGTGDDSGASSGSSNTNDSTATKDEGKHTNSFRENAIVGKCISISGQNASKRGTPQNSAMRWMIEKDKMKLDVESSNFVQRYVVALMYFAMGGDLWSFSFWLSAVKNECVFSGITCDAGGRITNLSFENKGMSGFLPKEISQLTELEEINFSGNEISGNIPSEWNSLIKLETLLLKDNEMSGLVPLPICELRHSESGKLNNFEVDCNEISCSCCDSCPDSMAAEYHNSVLQSDHMLTTNAPTRMPTSSPIHIELTDPRAMAIKEKLKEVSSQPETEIEKPRTKALNWIINVDSQKLSASAPRLQQRYIMAVFYFILDGDNWSHTPWLSGETSVCYWFGVTCNHDGHVTAIVLPSGNLSGMLPYELGQLPFLKFLNLSNNNLVGDIPKAFDQLPSLSVVILHTNKMTGSVPDSVCMLREMADLTVLWLDCGDDDDPKISCSSECCTKCGNNASDFSSNIENGENEENEVPYSGENSQPSANEATTGTGTDSRVDDITSALKNISTGGITESARAKALNWVTDIDTLDLSADDSRLNQRYIVAVLYFALDGENWKNKNWLSSTDAECDWHGVQCDADENIIGLVLKSAGLRGRIPYELASLSKLKTLDLSDNHIQGQIPTAFGNLPLGLLILYNNEMDGQVPDSICSLKHEGNLHYLWLDCGVNDAHRVICSCCSKCSAPEH